MDLEIREINEYRLNPMLAAEIACLLQLSFTGYPAGKHFLHQIPSFRILAIESDEIIGHVAIHHRVISSDGEIFNVFGIADLCVAEENRKAGVAGEMLDRLEIIAVESGIDFLVLLTNVHDFYLKKGFQKADNPCRWMMIQNNHSLGLVRRRVEDGLMYKQMNDVEWPVKEIDLMGHVF
ncbi:MAG: GNAT family N-acetyltransferase [Saprospirales bacterium]|nr:MAG: GNAT family N-acetyltransferase [Saprospirales bacterium]